MIIKLLRESKKENGYVLVITMVAIIFVSLIGAALLRLAYSDYINTNFYVRHKKAYYIARSGAEAVKEWIANNDASVLAGKTTDEIDLGSGSYQVTVHKNDNIYTIESTGKVNDVKNSVGVDVVKIDNPQIDHTVFTDQGLFINNSNILKDKGGGPPKDKNKKKSNNSGGGSSDGEEEILTFGTNLPEVHENVVIDSDVLESSKVELSYELGYTYSLPKFPEADFKDPSNDDVSDFYMGSISDDDTKRHDYDQMIIGSNTNLTIDVSGDENLNIYINSLDLKGNIVVNTDGDGVVNLYIKDSLSITSQGKINAGEDTDNINIYHYNEDGNFNLSGKRTINANFYTQAKKIKFTGQGAYYGNLFAYNEADIDLTGNGGAEQSIIYAPKSNVKITGNSDFKGAIISNIATFTGNGTIKGDPENISLPKSFETKVEVTWRDI